MPDAKVLSALVLWRKINGHLCEMERAIIALIGAELQRVLMSQDVGEKLIAAGFEARTSTPDAFAEMMRIETAKWARVVSAAGIKVH